MQAWEYLFVTFEVRQPTPSVEPDWYLSYASNQQVAAQTAPTIHTYTNQQGAEGRNSSTATMPTATTNPRCYA